MRHTGRRDCQCDKCRHHQRPAEFSIDDDDTEEQS